MHILTDPVSFPEQRPAVAAAPALLDLLPVVLGLREALARRSEVTIRVAELPGLYGATTFAGNTVYLDAALPDEQWRPTLVHELLHVLRGRFIDVDAEETLIRGVVDDVEALLTAGGGR